MEVMSSVKTLQIKGEMTIRNRRIPFTKEVRALSEKDAVEIIYNEIGSKHKLKRYQIKILEIGEINPNEAKTLAVRKLAKLGEEKIE
jgi:large subunit ribosomal protein LX